jgi:hypothetical protein
MDSLLGFPSGSGGELNSPVTKLHPVAGVTVAQWLKEKEAACPTVADAKIIAINKYLGFIDFSFGQRMAVMGSWVVF